MLTATERNVSAILFCSSEIYRADEGEQVQLMHYCLQYLDRHQRPRRRKGGNPTKKQLDCQLSQVVDSFAVSLACGTRNTHASALVEGLSGS